MNWITPLMAIVWGFLVLLGLEWWAILRAHGTALPKQQVIGQGALVSTPIPKIIWCYWHENPPPDLIVRCVSNWKRHASDHEVRMLNAQSLAGWIGVDKLDDVFASMPKFRQADWARLKLLECHGGIWIDASIFLTRGLEWVHEWRDSEKAEYIGFYIDRYSKSKEFPIVENWFMAAVPGSLFVKDLAAEFDRALVLGEEAYLDDLRRVGRYTDAVQGLDESLQKYLMMHVAASDLLVRQSDRYRLGLFRAEDSAFAYHAALRWRKRHLYFKLALARSPSPKSLPPLIKLRGIDRKVIEAGIAKGWLRKDSLIGIELK